MRLTLSGLGLVAVLSSFYSGCASIDEGGASKAATTGPIAERPVLHIGDSWVRADGHYELIRIEDDLYIFANSWGTEWSVSKDLTIAGASGRLGWVRFEPPPRLQWPLQVGRTTVSSGIWKWHGGSIGVFYRTKVEAFEDVSLPFGIVKAFRIHVTLQQANGWTATSRMWYSPELQQLVKGEAEPDNQRWGMFRSVGIRSVAPLAVVLEGLPDQGRLDSDRVSLVGRVTGGRGIAKITVQLNGREVSNQEDKSASKRELKLDLPLRLQEKQNILLVTATDVAGQTRQEARTLYYDPPVTASPAPNATPETPSPGVTTAPATPAAPAVSPIGHFSVVLSSPTDRANVERETIGLAAMAASDKGVRKVVVSLNGTEVSRQDEQPPRPSVALNAAIKLQEGQNTIVVTGVDSEGTSKQAVSTVYYDKPVPLSVAIQYPGDGLLVNQENSVVAGLITSSKGISRVAVTLNGIEVHQQVERAPEKSMALSVPLTLREGANVIVVTAREPDGTVRQEVRTVVFQGPRQALPASIAIQSKIPDRWAVIIGVGQYESSDIPKLRYTVSDAEAMYHVLTGLGGFKKEHVLLLTDTTERRPTYRNVKWALGTFLARSAKKDDTVLIYFAGHGAPEVDQRGVERDGLSKYLVPVDAEPDDLYSTALPMDELQTIFGRLEAERIIVFLDSCYSGAAGGRTFASKKTRASHIDEQFLERLTASKGRAIITASRPTEVSLELAELGHGLFTYYLVQGLKGAADLNQDGIIVLQELYEYLEQNVTQKSRAVGGNQHPVMKGELEGVLPIIRVK
jgi:hypothetical protein